MSDHTAAAPRMSIVVPVYNGKQYIGRMIRCLNAQTCGQFEVIFVDDGSTDGTAQALSELQREVSFPVTVLQQENAGVSAARNAGVKMATGEYLGFLDADDVVSPLFVEKLLEAAQALRADVTVCYATRQENELATADCPPARRVERLDMLRSSLYDSAKYRITAMAFHRQFFVERGFSFPVGFRYSEDVYLAWQILALVDAVVLLPAKLYWYVDNPGSAMNQMDVRRKDAIELMERLEPFMKEHAPEFAPEFEKYVVARHHWSILWQAALNYNDYSAFDEYQKNFAMKESLEKLFDYPDVRVRLTARLFCRMPRAYYYAMRVYLSVSGR